VAPDLRGYGEATVGGVEKYSILDDIGDIVGLVDALVLSKRRSPATTSAPR